MKVLLASDGSPHSMKAAEKTRWLATVDPKLEVIVLCVRPRPVTVEKVMAAGAGVSSAQYVETLNAWGKEVLDQTTAALKLPSGRVSTRLLVGEPGEVIAETAAKDQADMIVMGARGEGLARALLLGSTSHRVLQLAPCSVLIAR